MPWTKGILLFTMAVMALSSSLKADYGVVSEDTIRVGKLLIGDEAQSHPAKAKLQRLGTTVHCGNDSMTLRVPGSRTPHFLVDRGVEGSPVPLSEMPDSCGFSLKRVRRDISLIAPYKGCNVRQQSGSYILPLIIMGAPVQMSCPVSARLPTVSCLSSAMIVALGVGVDDIQVKVAGSWQPLLLTYSQCSFTLETVADSLVLTAPFTGSCWEMKDTELHLPLLYGDREVTLSCPMTPTVPTPVPTGSPNDPVGTQQMFYPFPFGRPLWYPYPNVDLPAMPPTTTTTPPPPPPQDPMSQQFFYPMYPMKGFEPYYYSKDATTTTTTPPHPPQDPIPQPVFYPMNGFAPYYPVEEVPTVPPPPQDPIFQQMFQYMYPMQSFAPYHYSKDVPTMLPPTTTTAPPPQDPIQQQMFPPMYPMKGFDPYYFYRGFQPYHRHWFSKFSPSMYGFQIPAAMTTPTATPAPAPQDVPYGYPPGFFGQQPSKSFVPPNVQYPFMPQYPQSLGFGPRSLKPNSSPTSIYRSRRR